VIFAVVVLSLYIWRKKVPWLLLPWGIHILMDIPTHTDFFPTPFLFPLSDWHFPWGISWAEGWLLLADWILLGIIFTVILVNKYRSKPATKVKNA
jgi:hypothetical protein